MLPRVGFTAPSEARAAVIETQAKPRIEKKYLNFRTKNKYDHVQLQYLLIYAQKFKYTKQYGSDKKKIDFDVTFRMRLFWLFSNIDKLVLKMEFTFNS